MITMKREVRVKIAFPIFSHIFVQKYILVDGVKQWVQFKFDLLPLFSFKFGWFDHEQRACEKS